jgi:ADP-heptose:LPS heptosyltransferase
MGIGDEILAAGQAQRAYDADPSRLVAICGADGRARWHPIWDGNPIIAHPDTCAAGELVQCVINGPGARPYIVYPFTKETGWTFNRAFKAREHIARLYLTREERTRGTEAMAAYGPYVLIEPYTKHDNLRWPFERWTALVAACSDLTFVQHIHPDSTLVPGAHYEPATFREACGLLQSARLYVRSESGLCHAAAALGRPTVTIWGGCMDWEVLGGYPGQTGLVDREDGSPCGRWHPCPHCHAALARITVDEVVTAIRAALRRDA